MKGKRLPLILLAILIITLPLLLFGIKQTLDNRSSAASADKLEAEDGSLIGNAISKTDSSASGGNYVELGVNSGFGITSGPTVSEITDVSANITWYLNENATGVVEYGTTTSYGLKTAEETSFNWDHHVQTITGLTPGTTYHYRVTSTNSNQNTVSSPDQTFTTTGGGITPGPTSPPNASKIYGTPVSGDALNNPQIGGPNNQKSSYRFRATQTSALNSIRVYIIDETHSGYGAGTGGTMRITVRPDDGTSNHFPSSTILATKDVPSPNDGADNVFSFSSPPNLVAGNLYHIVFENIDSNPTQNYVSIDGLYQFDTDGSDPQWQPGFSNTDWAHLEKLGGGHWSTDRGNGAGTITPIMQLSYANGANAGMGYIETWPDTSKSQGKTITGSNNMVREAIAVSGGNKTVTAVNIKIKRASGSGPLNVRLENGNGTVIEQGSIPSSQIPVSDPGNYRNSPTWAKYQFTSPRTLSNGQSYNIVFSTDSNTSYGVFAIREGKNYGYQPATYFADGKAQETSNGGSSWVYPISWNPTRDDAGDWQIYFNLQ